MNSENINQPKVLIGMSTFNSAGTVRKAIESVVGQSYSNWQLNIRDANSTDETISICQEFQTLDSRICLIPLKETKGWLDSARNHIISANSDYFAFLDGDDFISSNWLSELVPIIEMSNCIAAFGKVKVIDDRNMIVQNSASNNKSFSFTNFESKTGRIASSLLLPESFGLVNVLYGVWKTTAIYELAIAQNLFQSENNWDFDYDQLFVLDSLLLGKIASSGNTSIFRRLKTAQSEIYLDKYGNYSSILRNNSIVSFLWEILTVRPNFNLYLVWLRHHKKSGIYFMILAFRSVISVFSRILLKIEHALR